MSSRQLSGILLGVVGILVLAIGGLSAILLLQGSEQQVSTPTVTQGLSSSVEIDTVNRELRLPGNEPVTLDPHLVTDAASGAYIVEVYSGLVTMNAEL
ncbi:MAG: hypothetical protein CL718_05365, partial [Chloroflexi bacterium]|nr:hypothetical protein [Chloroflexota bacterium]